MDSDRGDAEWWALHGTSQAYGSEPWLMTHRNWQFLSGIKSHQDQPSGVEDQMWVPVTRIAQQLPRPTQTLFFLQFPSTVTISTQYLQTEKQL